MSRAYRRGGRAETPGLEVDMHDALSRTLYAMAEQAVGIRGLLKKATGRDSPPCQAASVLVDAVRGLQHSLLAELDATHGEDAPAMVRTRYA